MQKIILVFCLALAVGNGEHNNDNRLDAILNIHRLRNDYTLKHYIAKLDYFNKFFTARLDSVEVHYDLISETLEQTEEHMEPIAILNDFTQQCVETHTADIPNMSDVEEAIDKCLVTARSQQAVLSNEVSEVIQTLEKYLENYFEANIKYCSNSTDVSQIVRCSHTVIDNTRNYIHEHKREFLTKMEAAACLANTYIKKTLDCSFTVQQDVIREVAKANMLVNRCIEEQECKPCSNHCNYKVELNSTIFSDATYLTNPLYNRTDINCVVFCMK